MPKTKQKGPTATPPAPGDTLDVTDVDTFIDALTRVLTAAERGRQAKGAGLDIPAVELLQIEEDKRVLRDTMLAIARRMNDA